MFWLDVLTLVTTILSIVVILTLLMPTLTRQPAAGAVGNAADRPRTLLTGFVVLVLLLLVQAGLVIYYFVRLRPWVVEEGSSGALGVVLVLMGAILIAVFLLNRIGRGQPKEGLFPWLTWAASIHTYAVVIRHVIVIFLLLLLFALINLYATSI